MLHELTVAVCRTESSSKRSKMAFVAAGLHIVSPAGIFLSAPYAESLFSFLNFLGCYLYSKVTVRDSSDIFGILEGAWVLVAGIIFGVATTVRGNGLLSGLILIYDAARSAGLILQSCDCKHNFKVLVTICVSGSLMACIAFSPQYLAYGEYCYGGNAAERRRPWCSDWVPSIYGWVQKEYW